MEHPEGVLYGAIIVPCPFGAARQRRRIPMLANRREKRAAQSTRSWERWAAKDEKQTCAECGHRGYSRYPVFDGRNIVRWVLEDETGWEAPSLVTLPRWANVSKGRYVCPECVAALKEQQRAEAAARKRAKDEAMIAAAKRQSQKEAAAELRRIAMHRTHSHIRRVREADASGSHSTAEWLLKLDEFGHKCAYCGEAGHDFHRDHLVPLAAGGSNDIANIVPACAPCNLSKGARSGAELLRWIAERQTSAGRTA
jgi:5-methylcytosine-specific restriction endonuclease McrA